MDTSLLKELKQHLDNITEDEFKKEWSEIKKMDLEGPTVEEYLKTLNYIKQDENTFDN